MLGTEGQKPSPGLRCPERQEIEERFKTEQYMCHLEYVNIDYVYLDYVDLVYVNLDYVYLDYECLDYVYLD